MWDGEENGAARWTESNREIYPWSKQKQHKTEATGKKSHIWDHKYYETGKSLVDKEQSGTEMKWRPVLCCGWWWIDEAQRTRGDKLQEEHMKSCVQLECWRGLRMENPRTDDFINFIWTNVSVSKWESVWSSRYLVSNKTFWPSW